MTFIDDNFLDNIITRLTREHRDILMATAKRLNLPDDDVLFLYIGAIEYTVQLCEDILGGIRNERQSIEQSAKDTQMASVEQAEAIIKNLIQVAKAATADIQKSGMDTTSAIAEANSEVLSKSKETVIEAQALKDQLTDLITRVNADRQTNKDVLEVLLERMGQSIGSLNTAITKINSSHTALTRLQQNTKWIKFTEWFSPLAALVIVLAIGAGGSWWAMSLKYNDSLNVIGRDLVNWNADRIFKCREDNNPKCTIWVVPPEQRK